MLRNYLAAALRNLLRNRAYAAINLFGLALGFTAAILIALYVRDEFSFDRFWPNHERIYKVGETYTFPGQAPGIYSATYSDIPSALQLDFPQIDRVTRFVYASATLRHGDIEASIFPALWADPGFFRMFPVKAIAGDVDGALDRPDGVVITRKIARRFFGRDQVVGQTIELNREHVMRITAVIDELPSNTHLAGDVFLPGVASFSELTRMDAAQWNSENDKSDNTQGYIRLQPGAKVADINTALRRFVDRHLPRQRRGMDFASHYMVTLTPIAQLHLHTDTFVKSKGDLRTLQAMIGVALLILFVAGSNFVNMMTARAAGRAVEVGVRKAVGATRRQIIGQFMGECMVYVGLSLALAVVAVDLIMPAVNGFLRRSIAFDYLSDPILGSGIIVVALLTGLAAGAYPSLVLSHFRPNAVLKGAILLSGGSGRLRQTLVIFQFGTLIALIVATITIHRQTQYAIEERLRLPSDQIYLTGTPGDRCSAAFVETVARVRGVHAVSCPASGALDWGVGGMLLSSPNREDVLVRTSPIDYRFFDLFGIKPLAGRLFAQDHGADDLLSAGADIPANPSIVLNETALRALGFSSPEAAIGQSVRWARLLRRNSGFRIAEKMASQVVGVVPDFPYGSVREPVKPIAYFIDPSWSGLLILKLDGHTIPDTLRALEDIWIQQGAPRPFEGRFLSQILNDLAADIKQQSTLFSAFAAVVLIIAALGLLGLAVFTAERRTREIGLRKAMGASRMDILRFLGWQFARPVLWANLIAWPLAYFVMRRWLEGFAYHVDLSLLVFVAASVLALIIALATVAGHALLVARAKPVEALRYE